MMTASRDLLSNELPGRESVRMYGLAVSLYSPF